MRGRRTSDKRFEKLNERGRGGDDEGGSRNGEKERVLTKRRARDGDGILADSLGCLEF
jgi:hypothetical protein